MGIVIREGITGVDVKIGAAMNNEAEAINGDPEINATTGIPEVGRTKDLIRARRRKIDRRRIGTGIREDLRRRQIGAGEDNIFLLVLNLQRLQHRPNLLVNFSGNFVL